LLRGLSGRFKVKVKDRGSVDLLVLRWLLILLLLLSIKGLGIRLSSLSWLLLVVTILKLSILGLSIWLRIFLSSILRSLLSLLGSLIGLLLSLIDSTTRARFFLASLVVILLKSLPSRLLLLLLSPDLLSNIIVKIQELIMKILQLSQVLLLRLTTLDINLTLPYHLIKPRINILIKVSKKKTFCFIKRLKFFLKQVSLLGYLGIFYKTIQKIVLLIKSLKYSHLNFLVKRLNQKLSNNLWNLISKISYDNRKISIYFGSKFYD
jgi:hypothetical protein